MSEGVGGGWVAWFMYGPIGQEGGGGGIYETFKCSQRFREPPTLHFHKFYELGGGWMILDMKREVGEGVLRYKSF